MTIWWKAYEYGLPLMLIGMGSTVATSVSWWRDCIIESDMGMHTEVRRRRHGHAVSLYCAVLHCTPRCSAVAIATP